MSESQQQLVTSNQRSPIALNLAYFLRDNKILKQRTGLLNNNDDIDFFRFKRLERALVSDEYKKRQKNPKNGLLPISDTQEVAKAFILLIQNQLIIPVEKLHFSDVKKVKGWKPNKTKPTLRPIQKATLEPDSYYAWTYVKPNPFMFLYSILLIVGVFTVVLFPLWPTFMKVGVWYLSMAALCVLGLFFLLAIIRLILYIISLVAFSKPLWIFPNLFEDCGVIESFQPLYGWEESKKSKKGKKSSEALKYQAPIKGAHSAKKDASSDQASEAQSSSVSTGSIKSRKRVTLEDVDE